MKSVIQKVKSSFVKVDGKIIGQIGKGLLVFFAVHVDDKKEKIKKMAEKILNLRIFEDGEGKMNLSLRDVGGEILVVSQFTLYGDCAKGNRPSFIESARPETATVIYEEFIKYLRDAGIKVETGEFGGCMEVMLINDGPTTIIYEI